MVEAMQASLGRVRRQGLRPLGLRERPARGRSEPGGSHAGDSRASRGTPTAARARCGCARPTSATTRTACWCAPSGEHTYFASDIAYHQDKRERGFDRQIDVWGADHHGYVPRMKAAYEALGGDPDQLELLIMQLVHLVRRGERAQMSKRAGEFVTLDDLLAEIGVDAMRWYLLARSHDTTVDLDLDLARRAVQREPRLLRAVRARADLLDTREGRGAARAGGAGKRGSSPAGEPLHAAERALIELLLAFPAEVGRGGRAARPAPNRRLRARAGPELHRLLPGLPRGGRRAGQRRVPAHRAVCCERTHDRVLPGPARGERSGGDVASRSARGPRPGGRRRRRRAPRAGSPAEAGAGVGASGAAAGRARRAARAGPPAAPGRRRGRSRASPGSPSTAGPYWPTRAFLICASVSPSSIRLWMYARSRSACGDWATLSGILQVTHITWRSITGSDVRGTAAAAVRRRAAAASDGQRARRAAQAPTASHELSASAIARFRKAWSISPREMATTWPSRSMTKLSGSWSVP